MLPEKFEARMKKLLGDSYAGFHRELTEGSAVRGFRINSLKCRENTDVDLPALPLSYVRGGYILTEDCPGLGNTPLHQAGMIYIQDPGAMASAAALDIRPGMWIADLCAAPGGKSTQAAALLENDGFILSNEYVPKRAKILVSNFERMGIGCGMVTSLDTKDIARLFDSVFDAVIADAPCSGEGMFRKDVPAIEEWSEENVHACRARQITILNNAATLVKRGGKLLYSTCTYSIEENESVVDEFLDTHPDYRLIDVNDELKKVTSDGIAFEAAKSTELHKCRRFYPHVAPGEGQFLALLERTDAPEGRILYKEAVRPPSKEQAKIIDSFLRDNMTRIPEGRIIMQGDMAVLIPHTCPIIPRGVFLSGVLIGEIRGKNLFPAHQLFSVCGRDFIRQELLSDAAAAKYLAGEEIPVSGFDGSGYCALIYRDAPLGGGKASGGIIKNHYPKGLRVR
ncbi:MAG: hypothetical protein E7617_05455 [Ruminococcaceae bacterium]|nr:hypothetical protein [Oscillospiraceae bacterium]